MYSSIAAAAVLPAPIARITVAAPVTASPPAYTPSRDVRPCSSVIMPPHFCVSRPFVVALISGFGDVPIEITTASTSEFGRKPSFCAYGVLFSVLILLFHICDIFLPHFAELTCFRSAHCFPCKHLPPTSNIFVFRCFDGQNMLANRSRPWYNSSV